MKITYAVFLLFLLAVAASAQVAGGSSANSSGLLVIGKNWRILVPSSELVNEDPFRSNNDARQAQYDIKENIRENEARARAGLPEIAPRTRMQPIKAGSAPVTATPPAVYFYQMKVRNTNALAIRKITWEYVFYEQGTSSEVGRRRFVNEINISPNKTKNLIARSASPPTGTVDAAKTGKKLRNRYSEEIVINSIEFENGVVWYPTAASTK